jgi:activating signal cointegrator complex subunit 1
VNAGEASGENADKEPRDSSQRGGRGYRNRRRYGRNRPRVDDETEEGASNQNWNRRFNNRFTHFVSIPLNTEQIKERYLNLKSQIIERWSDGEDLFISEDLFQNPAKIHLTFGVMNLKDAKEEELASDLLKKCKENIIAPILNGQPLVLELKGLDTLPDRRSGKPRVAFARIGAGRDKLQAIADQVVNCFTENGIMKESEKDQVKLHITLMNTTFRHRAFRRRPQFWTLMKPPNFFDAAPILEQFGDYEFAESFPVKGLHISSATKFTEDGFYEPLTQLDF